MNDAQMSHADAVIETSGGHRLFTGARSQNGWLDRPVADSQLEAVYDLMKWGPTAFNCQPCRVAFLRTSAAKERLKPALMPTNVAKTLAAPVVAIVAHDIAFFDRIPEVFPHNPAARDIFANNEALAAKAGFRNATLQGGYFILAARAVGLDAGPMSGFDNARVDEEFFAGTTWRSNFLCGLGHGDDSKVFPRSPRLAFGDACIML
jgi:3-hydroxypropanoate dehydrogenase